MKPSAARRRSGIALFLALLVRLRRGARLRRDFVGMSPTVTR
jgi:hypothetical protein